MAVETVEKPVTSIIVPPVWSDLGEAYMNTEIRTKPAPRITGEDVVKFILTTGGGLIGFGGIGAIFSPTAAFIGAIAGVIAGAALSVADVVRRR
jgi:hypothetical protein